MYYAEFVCVNGGKSMEGQIAQILPNDIEAERSCLGCILISNDCIGAVLERIKSKEYFYRPNHQEIFEAIRVLNVAGTPVDIITLMNELVRRGTLEVVGGAAYLTDLSAAIPSVANLSYYVEIIVEKYKLRRLIAVSTQTTQDSYEAVLEAKDIIEANEKQIFDIAMNNEVSALMPIRDVLPSIYEKIDEYFLTRGRVQGVPTGFKELDKMIGGFQPAQLIIIACRPSMGKSSFAHNVAAYVGLAQKSAVAIFTLEMSKQEVAMRIISSEAGVDSNRIKAGEINEEEFESLSSIMSELESAPIYIDDTPAISIAEVRSKCRRIKDLKLIIIDYLTLMSTPGKSDNRQNEVSELSRQLKALSRTLNVPIIALAQLNRANADRKGHRPQLSDLRESGAIEQDADIVMFIHRPGYYMDDEEADKTLAEIIVAKQRNGAVGKVDLTWKAEQTRFLDRSYRQEP